MSGRRSRRNPFAARKTDTRLQPALDPSESLLTPSPWHLDNLGADDNEPLSPSLSLRTASASMSVTPEIQKVLEEQHRNATAAPLLDARYGACCSVCAIDSWVSGAYCKSCGRC